VKTRHTSKVPYSLNNINIACDWLSQDRPPHHASRPQFMTG